MDKFRLALFWNGIPSKKLAITLQIHKLQSKKTWLEAYRNFACTSFIVEQL